MLYMLILLFRGHLYTHHERVCMLLFLFWVDTMYNMSIAYNTVYFPTSNVVCGSGPRYPFRNANIIAVSISPDSSSLLEKKKGRTHPPESKPTHT